MSERTLDPFAPMTDYEKYLFEKFFSDPSQLPQKFKAWVADYVGNNGSFHVENIGSLETVLVPVGGVVAFAGDTAPDAFLITDGSAVSRTDYAKLFAVIGTSFGSGDGSTTFNIPSIKGKTIVGRDSGDADWDTLGETRGSKTHTLTVAEMPAHRHDLSLANDGSQVPQDVNDRPPRYRNYSSAPSADFGMGNTGGGGAHNNIQPSIVLNYIIRAA